MSQFRKSHRPAWLIILAACVLVGMSTGLRQVMGLYLTPMTTELGIGREPFSNAMAITNLVWGIAAIIAGAVADKYGVGRVVTTAALSTMLGLYVLHVATGAIALAISGPLLGIGAAMALQGAVGRAVPPERRTSALASLGMAGGVGGFLAFPYTHLAIEYLGWRGSLLLLCATAALYLPLALIVAGRPSVPAATKSQTLSEAMAEAFALPSFRLLVLGFFVCGFHVGFYSVHLPAFVADKGLAPWVAVWALMAVGAANLVGTYCAGQSAKWIERRVSLAFIYLMRTFAFLALLYLPVTPTMIITVSALLGFFWLSTVPLTQSLVAIFFGTQWMSMLFGFVFLSHQAGSFVGLWLAGRLYDATKSYDLMWWICIGLALIAALLHLPIRERPVPRLAKPAANVPLAKA